MPRQTRPQPHLGRTRRTQTGYPRCTCGLVFLHLDALDPYTACPSCGSDFTWLHNAIARDTTPSA